MPVTPEQEHIQALYNKRAKNDENSSTLAQTLETNIFTGFKGEHKFIYELLQNADDSTSDGQLVDASFEIKKIVANKRSYLIFTHSGAHFTKEDVEKICDNGQQYYQSKANDTKKIGYKGVGFKAVFSIADCVHVISNGYNFRFDQHYFRQNKEERKSYPWPIIPIQNQANDLSPELNTLVKPDRVNFILQIRPEVQIEQEIQFIRDNRMLMLFLRRVRSIELTDETETTTITVKREGQLKQFYINDEFTDAWLMHELLFDIPPAIRTFFNTLQDSECPQRLKAADQTSVTFAVQMDKDNQLVTNAEKPLFCYLPTQVNCGFQYVVNADFLLKPDRASLMDNVWNNFLMEKIGYHQFNLLAELSKQQEYRLQIFKLLSGRIRAGLNPAAAKEYNSGFEQGAREVAFISSLRDPARLVTVSNVMVDSTGFYVRMKNFDFKSGVLISNEQEEMERFLSVFRRGGEDGLARIRGYLRLEEVIHHLPGLAQINVNINFHAYMLSFLQAQAKENENVVVQLRGKRFILSEQNELCAPEEIYLPSPLLLNVAGVGKLNVIHAELLRFEALFKKVGVRTATRIEFIRGTIRQQLLKEQISIDNVLSVTRLIFEAYQAKELQKEDWVFLKTLPIKTQRGSLKRPHECYLSDAYQPRDLLETVLLEADIFVSTDYSDATHHKAWKTFLERLGVKGAIKVRHTQQLLRKDAIVEKPYIKPYLNFLQQEESCPQRAMTEEEMAGHYIENFVEIDLIEYSSSPVFADLFWERLLNAWEDIKSYSQQTYYHLSRKSNRIEKTYLQFCFEQAMGVISNQHGVFTTSKLFMPSLYEVVGEALPVAHIRVSMTEEQARFFGFKTVLTVDDCLHVLSSINDSPQYDDPSRYSPVLKYLVGLTMVDADIAKLKQWDGHLLAQDNTKQAVRNLQYCDLPVDLPKKSGWLKQFPQLSADEMLKLAKLFNIPVLKQDVIEVSMTKANPEESARTSKVIYSKLAVMALIEADFINKEPVDVLASLMSQFDKLTFCSAHRVSIKMNHDSKIVHAYLQNDHLYFAKRFNQTRTYNDFCAALGAYFGLTQFSIDKMPGYLSIEDPDDLEEYFQDEEIDPKRLPSVVEAKLGLRSTNLVTAEVHDSELLQVQAGLAKLTTQDKDESENKNQDKEEVEDKVDDSKEAWKKKNAASVKSLTRRAEFTGIVAELPDLDIKAIEFDKMTLHPKKKNSPDSSTHLHDPIHFGKEDDEVGLTQEERSRIGRLAEQIVYQKLMQHYKSKYVRCVFQETQQGFKLVGERTNKATLIVESIDLEVIWYNKGLPLDQDRGESKDFTIKKNGMTRHVEVKGTPSTKKGVFKISAREWDVMHEYANRYRLFRVFGVGSKMPRIRKIKNPAEAIRQGEIEVKSYELKI